MNKKLFTLILIIFAVLAFAADSKKASADSTILQKTVESIQDLIDAKDTSEVSLAYRIQTFNQVIDLALSEVKDLKTKIAGLTNLDEKSTLWLKENMTLLDKAIDYYNSQKDLLAKESPITLDWIKKTANDFKTWREEDYLPTANKIFDLLLINQERKAIDTTQTRFQKINLDIDKIKKSNPDGVNQLLDLLGKADESIKEAVNLNDQANKTFWSPNTTSTSSSTPADAEAMTSTESTASSTDFVAATSSTTSTATSSIASSTEDNVPVLQPLSIKDLVRKSLNKIKDAYQIFIEMSNLVRKLPI